jgi:hypothetical protein
MFSISVATSATSSNSFVGATASVDGTQGLVPGPAAGKQLSFLRGDATWQSAVVGPVSSTNTDIATFNGTLGSTLQSSGVTVSATQDLAGAKTLALSGATSGVLTLQPAATTTSYTTTMPSLQGAANSVLQNNGAGILSWALLTGMKGIQYITSSGAYTPTAGTTRALVFVTGGGGAGGGAASGVNNSVGSGGNSGGTYVGLFVIDNTKTGTVTIGPGGTGVSGGGGNNGTDTTFLFPSSGTPNATITGDGGNGGNNKPTGTNDRYFILSDNDRAPGSATATNAVLLGGFPIFGTVGGTGSLNDPDIGGSGLGANSIWGGGAGAVARNDTNGSTAGNSATANSGSGGSGAIQTNNSGQTGGAGGSGRVVILEY